MYSLQWTCHLLTTQYVVGSYTGLARVDTLGPDQPLHRDGHVRRAGQDEDVEDSHGDCDEDKDGIIDCDDRHEYDMDDIGEYDVDFNKKVHFLKMRHNT